MNSEKCNVRKTYGVKGLIEWHMQIPVKSKARSSISVEFTGGQITGYGVSPARYATSDPYMQKLIESTVWYRKKKIFILDIAETRGSRK